MKLKYQVGQRFRCLVPQRLVLGMANGVPVPFGQVASDTKRARAQGIDVPVGTVVVLEADFQCRLPDGTTKRAYVLRVEGQPVFFSDRVLTRKYERVIVAPNPVPAADQILVEEDARILAELEAGPPFTPFDRGSDVTSLTEFDVRLLQGDPVPIVPMVAVVIEEPAPDPGVDVRFVRACLAALTPEPGSTSAQAWADLEAAGLCLESDAAARGVVFGRPGRSKDAPCRNDPCPGTYTETSLHDDMDGVLHCPVCGDCVDNVPADVSGPQGPPEGS